MIVIYSNKPFLSDLLAHCLLEKYPNKKIVYIHSMYFTNVSFEYPKNIKWNEFPYIKSPEFKINTIENWKATTLIGKKLKPVDITFQEIKECEKIIYASDIYDTDIYLFSEFIEAVFNKKITEMNIEAIYLHYLTKEDISKAINEMKNFAKTSKEIINKGKIKKYFDYNFNFNSFALLGKAYQHINKVSDDNEIHMNRFGKIFISKNMLQVLYFIKNQQNNNINYKEGSLLSQMKKWKGTGKYTFKVKIGNESSSASIIENLLILKLLELRNKEVFITTKGQAFLNFLPKDCMDYDLPFRIELWNQQPFEESKIKIDNYLNSYYKKIKNKLKELNNL